MIKIDESSGWKGVGILLLLADIFFFISYRLQLVLLQNQHKYPSKLVNFIQLVLNPLTIRFIAVLTVASLMCFFFHFLFRSRSNN